MFSGSKTLPTHIEMTKTQLSTQNLKKPLFFLRFPLNIAGRSDDNRSKTNVF